MAQMLGSGLRGQGDVEGTPARRRPVWPGGGGRQTRIETWRTETTHCVYKGCIIGGIVTMHEQARGIVASGASGPDTVKSMPAGEDNRRRMRRRGRTVRTAV